ncbi:hypothetical protein WA158_001095 [Blastocystis sp. Blastoise]
MPFGTFNYMNPTRIIFGRGQIAKLGKMIPKDKTVLMLYGGGSIKRNGVYDQCKSALKDYEVAEFGGIPANPEYTTLLKAIKLVKEIGPSKVFLLPVGGGSVIDGSKFVSVATNYDSTKEPWHILETCGRYVKSSIPLGTVLTLPATGSESNSGAVISWKEKNLKMNFNTPYTFPLFSILDPETTFSLPPRQTSNGIIDSIIHICEQYVTNNFGADVQDRYSEALIKVLLDNGSKVLQNPTDYQLRANIMWAATQALNKWLSVGVPQDWSTHMIGHEITAYKGLDHAQTLACIQPSLYRYKMESKQQKLAQLGERVFNIQQGNTKQKAEKVIEQLEFFYHDILKVETKLSNYPQCLDKQYINEIKKKFTQNGVKLGEDKDILPDDVVSIINNAY